MITTSMRITVSLVIFKQLCISLGFLYYSKCNHFLMDNEQRNQHRKKNSFIELLAHPRHEQESAVENNPSSWTYMSEIARIKSPWITIVAEHFQNEKHVPIDYWRIERPDSVIVIVLHNDMLLFPKAQYRPGINETTLDFCGGRVPSGMEGEPIRAVPGIVERELGFHMKQEEENVTYEVTSLNTNRDGWPVDSSVSSQRLFGFLVNIRDDVELDEKFLHERKVNVKNATDVSLLFSQDLKCLQCRSLLMEWILHHNGPLN